MVQRGKGRMTEAKASLEKALGLIDETDSSLSDGIAIEIAEEAAQHGEVGRAASIIATMSAVSYTHLDVYKRQVATLNAFRIGM